MDLGYWLLNDIVWVKSNPMPKLPRRGASPTPTRRCCGPKEQRTRKRYTFNHHTMKRYTTQADAQRLEIPLCTGPSGSG